MWFLIVLDAVSCYKLNIHALFEDSSLKLVTAIVQRIPETLMRYDLSLVVSGTSTSHLQLTLPSAAHKLWQTGLGSHALLGVHSKSGAICDHANGATSPSASAQQAT